MTNRAELETPKPHTKQYLLECLSRVRPDDLFSQMLLTGKIKSIERNKLHAQKNPAD